MINLKNMNVNKIIQYGIKMFGGSLKDDEKKKVLKLFGKLSDLFENSQDYTFNPRIEAEKIIQEEPEILQLLEPIDGIIQTIFQVYEKKGKMFRY